LFGDSLTDLSALESYWSPRRLVTAALASGDRLPPDRQYGHQGEVPGYTTFVARTESGRCVVLWQNGMDLHGPLCSDTAFVQAALCG
jgi:hypothetical protein